MDRITFKLKRLIKDRYYKNRFILKYRKDKK